MNLSKLFPATALASILLVGCVKDEVDVRNLNYNIHPEIGIPIAKANILASRIIDHFDEDGFVSTDSFGQLSLIYSDSLQRLSIADILDLGSQNYENSFAFDEVDLGPVQFTGSVTFEEDRILSFESQAGDRLDSIRFVTGLFSAAISSSGDLPFSGSIKVVNPDNTVIIDLPFTGQGSNNSAENQTVFTDLLLLPINNDQFTNGFRVRYEFTFSNDDGGEIETQEITVNLGFTDFSIASAGGFIAPRSIDLNPQGIDIDLFSETFNGEFRIEDPKIDFNFLNGFGLELGLDIKEITATNSAGQTMTANGENILFRPVLDPAPSPGEVKETVITISNQHISPTVTEFLAFKPDRLFSDFSLDVNPQEKPSSFISNQDELAISYDLEIPIYGSISDFRLVDTTTVTLGDLISDTEKETTIEALDIRLIVDNGLPINTGVQIIFTDSLFQPIESLFDEPNFIFTSAPVDLEAPVGSPNHGRATGSTRQVTDIAIPRDRILQLKDATHIIIDVVGGTTANGSHPIRLYSNDFFDVQLSAKATLNLND